MSSGSGNVSVKSEKPKKSYVVEHPKGDPNHSVFVNIDESVLAKETAKKVVRKS